MNKFNIGDKVRYKESEKKNAEYNGHSLYEVYTVRGYGLGGQLVEFKDEDQGCYDFRLELAESKPEPKFKVGDKVKIVKNSYCGYWDVGQKDDLTVHSIEFVAEGLQYNISGQGRNSEIRQLYAESDLELIDTTQESTFDYKRALQILAEDPELPLQRSDVNGNWFDLHSYSVDVTQCFGVYVSFNKDQKYRVKVITKPTFHYLIKSKGKFSVTSSKYASEDEVKAGYSYPIQVIQKLED